MHHEAQHQVLAYPVHHEVAEAVRRAQVPHETVSHVGPHLVVPDERDAPLGGHPARGRLGHVVQEGGDAEGMASREAISQGLRQRRRHHVGIAPEDSCGIALNGHHVAEHLHGVPEDVQVVVFALIHPAAVIQLGHQGGEPTHTVQQVENRDRVVGTDDARELIHHPFTGCIADGWSGGTGGVARCGVHCKPHLVGDTRQAQYAHRIVQQCRR